MNSINNNVPIILFFDDFKIICIKVTIYIFFLFPLNGGLGNLRKSRTSKNDQKICQSTHVANADSFSVVASSNIFLTTDKGKAFSFVVAPSRFMYPLSYSYKFKACLAILVQSGVTLIVCPEGLSHMCKGG